MFDVSKIIKFFLNEDSNSNLIERAIENNEYLYIYYSGDNTILKGYRTILPMVLGYSKKGELVIRAWQINGNSDSKKRYVNDKGKNEYGWRLFKLSGMTSVLPTGKRVSPKRIPPSFNPDDYNPDDSFMSSIIIAASPKDFSDVSVDKEDAVNKPTVTNNDFFNSQSNKFRQFYQLSKPKREITDKDIEELYNLNKKIRKKSPNKLMIVSNENGDFVLRDLIDKDKIPKDAYIGILSDLYNNINNNSSNINNVNNKTFFNTQKNKL